MEKFIKLADIRKLNKQVSLGEISSSRMIEIINDKASEYAKMYVENFKIEQAELTTEITDDAKPMLPAMLICDCSSREHQIIIEHNNEDNLTYCHIHLVKHGFWRRFKAGLKYIFGYKCRYGQWDEFILKPEHANQLRELSELLSQHSR
jgi:hypothetical protein